MGISTDTLPFVTDSLKLINNYDWMQNSFLSDSVKATLDTIKNRFRPQTNTYVNLAFQDGNPTFDTDSLYYSSSHYPSVNKRLLALFRYWNIINYFYPYKEIMDQNWDTTLVKFIPKILDASDSVSYSQAIRVLNSRTNDSHGGIYSEVYSNWLGRKFPPFQARFIENEMVITKILPNVSEVGVGDIIKEIDGEDIYTLRDSLRKYSYGSNPEVIERVLNSAVLRGDNGIFPITVFDGTNTHTDSLMRNSTNYDQLNLGNGPVWWDTIIDGSCKFGIVDMAQLEPSQVGLMFSDFSDADAIIFDLRNYPNGTLWRIVNYIYPSAIHIANFTVPDITNPGTLYWNERYIGTGTQNPYKGTIIILFDERTQSQAEYTCMGLEQFPNAIKIGSTTAAADGNISRIYLPGNIYTIASFLGVYYPDYTPTQRVGIIPDIEVHPTIVGVRSHRDEVMEVALNCNFVGTKKPSQDKTRLIYPNPASNEIRYDCGRENVSIIKLFNSQGQLLRTLSDPTSSGGIDISGLVNGIYFITIQVDKDIVIKRFVKF